MKTATKIRFWRAYVVAIFLVIVTILVSMIDSKTISPAYKTELTNFKICIMQGEGAEPELSVEANERNIVTSSLIGEKVVAKREELFKLELQKELEDRYKEKEEELNKKEKKLKKKAKKLAKKEKNFKNVLLDYGINPNYPYQMSDKEFNLLCKLVQAEFGNQDLETMVCGANATINNAIYRGVSIEKEIFTKGRYSTVRNGVIGNKRPNGSFVPVGKVPDKVKEAVKMAQERDYTLPILKEKAEEVGVGKKHYEYGARYYYAPGAGMSQKELRKRDKIKVKFQQGDVIFYSYWNR